MKQLSRNPFFYLTIVLVFVVAFEVVNLVGAQYASPTQAPPGGQPYPSLDTSSFDQVKIGGLTTNNNLTMAGPNGTISLSSTAGVPVMTFSSGNTFAKLWLTPADGKIMALSGGKTFEIGSGGEGTAPLTLQTNSGGKGLILLRNPNDTSGNDSPMIVFSGFGAQLAVAPKKDIGFGNIIPVAHAETPIACDPDVLDCGSGVGIGTGGGNSDPLTQPVWWMRQEGLKFVIYASRSDLTSDVRDIATFTRGGSVVATRFYEKMQDGSLIEVGVPSGTWCGLEDGVALRWSCKGYNPLRGCPSGYGLQRFGKNSGLVGGNDWATCVKN